MSTLTPAQAAQHFRKAALVLPAAVVRAEQETIKAAKTEAVQMSSGPHSTAQLRAAGHPYGRKSRNAAYDAAIINAQSGWFRAAWRGVAPAPVSGGIVSRVANNSGPAKYLTGTRSMVARAIGQAVQKAVQPGRVIRLRRAVKQSIED